LIYFALDPKTGADFECQGAQFVTGGPDKTHPHTPFCFGDTDALRDMVYYQSIAWAVNAGVKPYLDSTLAYDVYRVLPEADAAAHGQTLLESGLSINPYNFVLADAAVADAATPQAELQFWKSMQSSLATEAGKPGCPVDSLYSQTVQSHVFAAIAKRPVPANKTEASAIYTTLKDQKCDNEEALALYQTATAGIGSLLSRTESDFKTHLASVRDEASCELMASELESAAKTIPDKTERTQWVQSRWSEIQGHEAYFGKGKKIAIDDSAKVLARLAHAKLPAAGVLDKPLLEQVTAQLQTSIAGDRDMKTCRQIAGEISAVAKQNPDSAEVHSWLENLATMINGHETFTAKNARRAGRVQRDPCADTIAKVLATGSDAKGA
jgi:hypothetical protein